MKSIVSNPPGSNSYATSTIADRWAWCLSVCRGLQKRLARYAQLYSRIGFVHQFRPLSGAELQTVIKRQSLQLGLGLELDDLAETNVVHAITRRVLSCERSLTTCSAMPSLKY